MEEVKFIEFTEESWYSNIMCLDINEIVNINGENLPAQYIKPGCIVIFNYHNKIMTYNIKYIQFSKYQATCFTGYCIVNTKNGKKRIDELKINDFVETASGYKQIRCILCTNMKKIPFEIMRHTNGLEITKYHPIWNLEKWCFPIHDLNFKPVIVTVDYIYSIGLINDNNILINDVPVITLGHGIKNDPIAYHPYFGTELIINDIFKLSEDGYCTIEQENIIRDENGLICGICDLK